MFGFSFFLVSSFFLVNLLLLRLNEVNQHKTMSINSVETLIGLSEATLKEKNFNKLLDNIWKIGSFENLALLDENCNVVIQRILNLKIHGDCKGLLNTVELSYPTIGTYYITWQPRYSSFISASSLLLLFVLSILLFGASIPLTKGLTDFFIKNFKYSIDSLLSPNDHSEIPIEFNELKKIINESYDLKARQREMQIEANNNDKTKKLLQKISHDMRSPLAVLETISLQKNSDMNDLYRGSISRLFTICNSLLDKPEEENRNCGKSFSLFKVCKEIIDQKYTEYKYIKEHLIININDDGSNNVISNYNKLELQTVLSNILNNSIEAGVEAKVSLITVNMQLRPVPQSVVITDNSGGIPKGLQPDIFKYGSSSKSNGNGLGLYYAKDFMEKNGGSISFTPTASGSKFSLYF